MKPITIQKFNLITRCLMATLMTGAASSAYAIECNDPARTSADSACTVTTASSTDIIGILSEGSESTDASGYIVTVDTPASATLQSILGGSADAVASTSNVSNTNAVVSRADANAASNNNTVIVNNGLFNGDIYGGYTRADGNSDAMVSAMAISHIAESDAYANASSNMNTIIINNGVFKGDIYGGYSF
ncbi:Uncharacterised protein [Yersinia intermedia]|uniref:hypothetical protein n=1 Tax=Yersinia intermedia TaxID=631 RepID=UPI0005DEB382|nr:hypothetical protein [Yersinia intermedia]CNH96397.1 Uncharacterised protein [Yersinia intermedia]